jgi:hypothetical protein
MFQKFIFESDVAWHAAKMASQQKPGAREQAEPAHWVYWIAQRLAAAISIAIFTTNAMAQTGTYSTNLVGYANIRVPAGYSLLANPLSTGVTNGANELGLEIPGCQILNWNGAGFNYASYDPSFGGWIDSSFQSSRPPKLPPGLGFFFFNPGPSTNILFVGQVVPEPGTTNTMSLPAGYSMVGSLVPADVPDITLAPVNLPLIPSMQILTWNGAVYDYSAYEPAFGGWVDANFFPKLAPSYSIGQGFFFYAPDPEVYWLQSLP